MVVLSLKQYEKLADDVEKKLDEADRQAESTAERWSRQDVFGHVNNLEKE